MQGKTKTTFINQSELEQRLNNQIKPTSFRLISGLEYTALTIDLLKEMCRLPITEQSRI